MPGSSAGRLFAPGSTISFPAQQSGEYLFYSIKVDPFIFPPMEAGLELTPLRAYAHEIPHYYFQNFGNAASHPDTNDYAAFLQDTIRVTDHLALSLGVRWDLQTFSTAGLISNPLFPPSGKVPYQALQLWLLAADSPTRSGNSIRSWSARDMAFSTSAFRRFTAPSWLRKTASRTLRFSSTTTNYYDRQAFPTYPNPLVSCALDCGSRAGCLPDSLRASPMMSPRLPPNFVTPRVQQGSLTLEKEVAGHTTVAVSYLYVHGEHLIRALDVNLPPPVALTYPIFNSTGSIFKAASTPSIPSRPGSSSKSLACPFPPCINPLGRPIAQLGAIDEFQSAASSVYNGATLSINRRMARGAYLRLSYTFARAIDDGQDALVAGQPATVQNSYNPNAERGPSVTDQRNRLQRRFFHRTAPVSSRARSPRATVQRLEGFQHSHHRQRPAGERNGFRRPQSGWQRTQRPPARLQPQRLHRT